MAGTSAPKAECAKDPCACDNPACAAMFKNISLLLACTKLPCPVHANPAYFSLITSLMLSDTDVAHVVHILVGVIEKAPVLRTLLGRDKIDTKAIRTVMACGQAPYKDEYLVLFESALEVLDHLEKDKGKSDDEASAATQMWRKCLADREYVFSQLEVLRQSLPDLEDEPETDPVPA